MMCGGDDDDSVCRLMYYDGGDDNDNICCLVHDDGAWGDDDNKVRCLVNDDGARGDGYYKYVVWCIIVEEMMTIKCAIRCLRWRRRVQFDV